MASKEVIAVSAARNEFDLMEIYDGLPFWNRSIVDLCSVAYHGISRASIANCLKKGGQWGADGRCPDHRELDGVLKNLASLGLLEEDRFGWHCSTSLVELVSRRLSSNGAFGVVCGVLDDQYGIPTDNWGKRSYRSEDQCIRGIRKGLYLGDASTMADFCDDYRSLCREDGWRNPVLEVLDNPFDKGWLQNLPPEVLDFVWRTVAQGGPEAMGTCPPWVLPAMEESSRRFQDPGAKNRLRVFIVTELVLRGKIKDANSYMEDGWDDSSSSLFLRGWLSVLRGEDGLSLFRMGWDALVAENGGDGGPTSIAGAFFPLAWMASGKDEKDLKESLSRWRRGRSRGFEAIYDLLYLVTCRVMDDRGLKGGLGGVIDAFAGDPSPLLGLFLSLSLLWADPVEARTRLELIERVGRSAKRSGYEWIAREIVYLLAVLDSDGVREHGDRASAWHLSVGLVPLADLMKTEPIWERKLSGLADLCRSLRLAERDAAPVRRLSWRVGWVETAWGVEVTSVVPVEQKFRKDGKWSEGRPVALKRLSTVKGIPDFLTEQDRKICRFVVGMPTPGGGLDYGLDVDGALPSMVGHPLLFRLDDPTSPVVLESGDPRLRIEETGGAIGISLDPPTPPGFSGSALLLEEAPGHIRLFLFNEGHRAVLERIGPGGISVPSEGRAKVLSVIPDIADAISILVEMDGDLEIFPEKESDRRLHVLLAPRGTGFSCRLAVRPLGQDGPLYSPGMGGRTLIGSTAGNPFRCRRDLKEELRLSSSFLAACPSLLGGDAEGDNRWFLGDPGKCLEFLSQMESFGDGAVAEWPQGSPVRIRARADMSGLRINVFKEREWLSVTGKVSSDDGLVLSMVELLKYMDKGFGRFVPLGDGSYLALSEELRRRLEELGSLGKKNGDGLMLPPLSIPVLREMSGGVGAFDADPTVPEVPSSLVAKLRDYQIDGFRWLVRMAHWGAGACLADDMGLGKTVQALALLLYRASEGPALVVCPTSVCRYWLSEMARFAPALIPHRFGQGSRKLSVTEAGPFHVLVVSYGFLQQESDLFLSRSWHTVVLDEAQAIKNASTKRARTAMSLETDFPLALTGTPIENHLGELWSLFRFITPGLFGSLERFNRKFALPIERDKDEGAGKRLRALVRPFILRRTKKEVLGELPPKTEIRVSVEMNREERAFYEALRLRAIERLEKESGDDESSRFVVLAEITRLRRSCCHPCLVEPSISIHGSKLAAFCAILEELRANGHRALVFSQFVDHLSIIRRFLDGRRISYQYLDGSSPPARRAESVDAFQRGDGDCFLISLKAGGLGLNLTAADYVIHMDPWWNPAVEDQASDRAHRIGQSRPVTVYRLVATDTVEERILEIHERKRNLAGGLLEGCDSISRLSMDELRNLIRDR